MQPRFSRIKFFILQPIPQLSLQHAYVFERLIHFLYRYAFSASITVPQPIFCVFFRCFSGSNALDEAIRLKVKEEATWDKGKSKGPLATNIRIF